MEQLWQAVVWTALALDWLMLHVVVPSLVSAAMVCVVLLWNDTRQIRRERDMAAGKRMQAEPPMVAYDDVVYWVESVYGDEKVRIPMRYKGLCDRGDEGQVGWDVKGRPTVLGFGPYVGVYGGDSMELADGTPIHVARLVDDHARRG